jgi:hypothetical protein
MAVSHEQTVVPHARYAIVERASMDSGELSDEAAVPDLGEAFRTPELEVLRLAGQNRTLEDPHVLPETKSLFQHRMGADTATITNGYTRLHDGIGTDFNPRAKFSLGTHLGGRVNGHHTPRQVNPVTCNP